MSSSAIPTGDVKVDSRWMVLLFESTPPCLWRCHEVAKPAGVTVGRQSPSSFSRAHGRSCGPFILRKWFWGSLLLEEAAGGWSQSKRRWTADLLQLIGAGAQRYRRCIHEEKYPQSVSLWRPPTQLRRQQQVHIINTMPLQVEMTWTVAMTSWLGRNHFLNSVYGLSISSFPYKPFQSNAAVMFHSLWSITVHLNV